MPSIIPAPKKLNIIDQSAHIIPFAIFTENREWDRYVHVFCDTFEKGHAKCLTVGINGGIELIYDEAVAENAYKLTTDGAMRIYASASE